LFRGNIGGQSLHRRSAAMLQMIGKSCIFVSNRLTRGKIGREIGSQSTRRLSSCGLLDAARQSSASHRYHNDSERLSALTLYSAHAPDAMSSCMTSLVVVAAARRPVKHLSGKREINVCAVISRVRASPATRIGPVVSVPNKVTWWRPAALSHRTCHNSRSMQGRIHCSGGPYQRKSAACSSYAWVHFSF